MSKHGASKDEGFGKDLGVMHEAAVTGRKVGLDKEFFASLAHDEGLFYRTIAFVKNGGRNLYTPYLEAEYAIGTENFIGPEQYWKIMKEENDRLFLPDDGMVPFSRRILEDVKDTHILVKVGHRFKVGKYYQGEIQIDKNLSRGATIGSSGDWHLIRRVDVLDATPSQGLRENAPHIGVLLQSAVMYTLHNPGKQLFTEPTISGTHFGSQFDRRWAGIAPIAGEKGGLCVSLYRENDDSSPTRVGREVWSMRA